MSKIWRQKKRVSALAKKISAPKLILSADTDTEFRSLTKVDGSENSDMGHFLGDKKARFRANFKYLWWNLRTLLIQKNFYQISFLFLLFLYCWKNASVCSLRETLVSKPKTMSLPCPDISRFSHKLHTSYSLHTYL